MTAPGTCARRHLPVPLAYICDAIRVVHAVIATVTSVSAARRFALATVSAMLACVTDAIRVVLAVSTPIYYLSQCYVPEAHNVHESKVGKGTVRQQH